VAAPNMVQKAPLAQLRPHAQPSRNGSPRNLHKSRVWSQGCKPTFGNSHPTAKKFCGKKPDFAKCKLNRVGMCPQVSAYPQLLESVTFYQSYTNESKGSGNYASRCR